MAIQRGEIYFVRLDPVIGYEIGGNKARPVVVVSINFLNEKPLVVTVVPGTKASNQPRAYRNIATILPTPENGLAFPTNFQCHQLRAMDHSPFVSPAVGRLSPREMSLVETRIRFSLGL